jgi:hypothetical protein
MDKRILKKIAELLSEEEIEYIQQESFKIAHRITKENHAISLNDIIKEYYEFE